MVRGSFYPPAFGQAPPPACCDWLSGATKRPREFKRLVRIRLSPSVRSCCWRPLTQTPSSHSVFKPGVSTCSDTVREAGRESSTKQPRRDLLLNATQTRHVNTGQR
ncbi:hypothetical protein SRHO_G00190170 [Serrasalmus rhombeus]